MTYVMSPEKKPSRLANPEKQRNTSSKIFGAMAAKYKEKQLDVPMIMTGSEYFFGKRRYDYMKLLAIKEGIKSEKIYCLNQTFSTFDDAKYVKS